MFCHTQLLATQEKGRGKEPWTSVGGGGKALGEGPLKLCHPHVQLCLWLLLTSHVHHQPFQSSAQVGAYGWGGNDHNQLVTEARSEPGTFGLTAQCLSCYNTPAAFIVSKKPTGSC